MLNKVLFLQHHPLNILARSTCAPEVPALSVAFCGFRRVSPYVQVNALATDTYRQMRNEILLKNSYLLIIHKQYQSYSSNVVSP
jgi:hypothetical protein